MCIITFITSRIANYIHASLKIIQIDILKVLEVTFYRLFVANPFKNQIEKFQ